MASVYTSTGEAYCADVLDGTIGASTAYWLGWGTGAGTAAKGDTSLFTESTEARVPVVSTGESQPTEDTNRWVGSITAGAAKTITNAGLFSSSAGSLIIHGDFTGVALSSGDSITFTVDLQQS